jgi:RNA polymerase sigma factor (sigma-70 family)
MTPKDQEKIAKAYSEEHIKLLGFIRKRIPLEYEAEDILHDVFYQLTRGFNEIDRIENLSAWLYRVANNRIIDNFRKKKYKTVNLKSQDSRGEDGPLLLEEILPDLSTSPEEEQLKEIIWEVINDTLENLPEEQCEVFVLHEFKEMSFLEISKKTGQGVNTLISRKRYAVLELRNRLKNVYKQLKIQ